MGILESISKLALKPSEILGNVITSGLEKITGKKYGRTTSEEASKTTFGKILGTAIAGTSVALGTAIAGGGSVVAGVGNIVKSLIPKTFKGKAVASAVGLVTIPALIKNPKLGELAVEGASKLPSSLVNVGTNIGEFTANPTIETAKDIFKENPLIVGGALGIGAVSVGKGLLGSVSTLLNTQAVKENTKIMETGEVPKEIVGSSYSQNLIQKGTPMGNISEDVPFTSPQTTTISTGKRKRRSKVKTSPLIRNSVRVNVINHNVGSLNRKFIKVEQLA